MSIKEGTIDDIDDLEASNHNLVKSIKQKLDSIRNKLKISFIGKLSTPKNLLIKQLTNVDLPPYNIRNQNCYCAIISEYEEANQDGKTICGSKKVFLNSEGKVILIGDEERLNENSNQDSDESEIIPMRQTEDLGSYLNEDINKDVDKVEIFLPQSNNSILNNCIIYSNPPIGYSDKLDKFVVEQSYKSCYLYIFVINKDESILEEEMKIIELLMEKKKVIEIKFVIACSSDMSKKDYIKIEQDYVYKIKEISERFPRIIIISGHGYVLCREESGDKSLHTNIMEVVSKENKINDLENFIRENPTGEMIWATVKKYKLKQNPLNKPIFVESNENIKRELQNSVENFGKIINFISKFVKSNELEGTLVHFNSTIRSISLDNISGSNYLIFRSSLINSLDILQAFVGRLPISNSEYLTGKLSIIKCNFNPRSNREYFVLQNDNESIIDEHDIWELINLSELISNLPMSSNENISIELYLDNEIHPIITDEMKIIYYNNLDMNNGELLNECENHDGIAVILDHRSDDEGELRNIIKHFQSKRLHVQFNILISHDEKMANPNIQKDIESKLQIGIGEIINVSNCDSILHKILSNLKYRKIANEIISLFQQFIPLLDKQPINFDGNIEDISDWKFEQLDDNINEKIKSIKEKSEESRKNILNIANEEIIKFVSKIFMENMNISEDKLIPGIIDKYDFGDAKIKEEELPIKGAFYIGSIFVMNYNIGSSMSKKAFLNYYAAERSRLRERINNVYMSKTKEILNSPERYQTMLNVIINDLQRKFCNTKIDLIYTFFSGLITGNTK